MMLCELMKMKTKSIGKRASKKPIRISTNNMKKTMRRETEIKNVFTIIPDITENSTSPSRYSFLRGLKKVPIKSGRDKSEATYRLNDTKNSNIPKITSLYQKTTR